MSKINIRWGWFLGIAICGSSIGSTNCAFAQITPDGTLPNNSSVKLEGNNSIIIIEGGTQAGGNLFHSFREFSVPTNGAALFNNAVDIQNIISRVTGGSRSSIDGLIYANGTANLFLINPNGIVFGQNARLNVGGSFVATTANAIAFGNKGFFSASNPESSSSLLTVNPSALLFNQIKTASIENNSFGLRVSDGKSLLLVGGDIKMDGGGLFAFGGRVELGGLAGTGTVELNGNGNNLSLSFPDSVERSNVFLSNNAGVIVIAGDGGSIAVNARNLEMTGQSGLLAGIESGLGSDNSKAGNIEVNATGAINLDNESLIANQVQPKANGQGGDVNINTNTLLVEGGAQVNASTGGAGKGGNLTVNAQDVQLIGTSADNQAPSGLFAEAGSNSTGNAGDLRITTNTLLVEGGAVVSASTGGAGKGGNLTVNAQDVQLIGRSADDKIGSGLFAKAGSNSTGNAGDLRITTNTLLVEGGAVVSASTGGAGKGGNLTVNAQDVQLIGTSADNQFPSALFAEAGSNSSENAGDLRITTNTLLVEGGAVVSASTRGAGKGGNLTINAQDVQLIRSADDKIGSGLFAQAVPNSTGNAGDLTIKTNTLLVKDGAEVSASTFAKGKGGNLTVNAQDVQLIGTSADNQVPSGLFAQAGSNSTGNAGDLRITTNTLLVEGGAQVSAATVGAGKGGNLTVNAQDVQLIGTSADNKIGSALFASAEPNSTGDAGDLTITTNTLLVEGGAQVSAGTLGAGKGGNLTVNAQDVQLIGTSADNQGASGLFAEAGPNSTGNAGDLTITTNTLLVEGGAQVSAGTVGAGKGGNLTVNAQDVQLIGTSADNQVPSALFAQAGSNLTGNAGDLRITTNTLLVEGGAQVSASTVGAGKGGNLTVNAQDVQLIGTSADNQGASGLFAEAGPNSTGNAGDLTITTNTLLVEGGAQVSAATFGAGKGGNLTVNAQDVQLIRSADDKIGSGLFAEAESNSTGNAGDLRITTNTLLVEGGAAVSAGTFGAGKGGNLTVNAQDVQLIGTSADNQVPSALFASAESNSTGNAGDLRITTNTLLVEGGAQVSAATFGAGKGGNLTVNAQDVQVIGTSADDKAPSGLFASALPNSTGNAGDLTIKTNTLLVKDGAAITVGSLGTGTAGIMTLNSRSIRLDNNALLIGNTQSAKVDPNREQATIKINSQDLIMSRNSNIRTNARGENVIGGNINIDTDFLIGFENSDISANSANFRGGNVRINAQGIFGIQFRDVASDKTSDITATGASSELSGNVEINTPDVDPNSGLVNLPTIPVDTQVAQTCQAGGNLAKSSFTITGRGGLPPNPGEALNTDAVKVDLVSLNPNNDRPDRPIVPSKTTTPAPEPIIEATGLALNQKGEVVLTANLPSNTPHTPWLKSASCRVVRNS